MIRRARAPLGSFRQIFRAPHKLWVFDATCLQPFPQMGWRKIICNRCKPDLPIEVLQPPMWHTKTLATPDVFVQRP